MWDTYLPPCTPLCLFVTCMFLYSIFLLFLLWVRQYSVCNIHTLSHVSVFFLVMFFVLCSHELFVFFTLFQFHIFYFIPVWTKAPPALFLKGILPVSDCMCLMHFGSLSPQHLTAFLSVLKQTRLSLLLFLPAFSLPSHLLLKKCHRKKKKKHLKRGHSAVHSAEAASQTYLCSF